MYKKYIVILIVFLSCVWADEVPRVVASIDSNQISRYQLASLLNDRYKLIEEKVTPSKQDDHLMIINSLQKRVVLAALEELITLELTRTKLDALNINCTKQEYVQEAKRAEKPFFNMYAKWGLENPISFLEALTKIIAANKPLNEKYGKAIQQMRLKFRLSPDDKKEILKIWQKIEKSKMHGKARQYVFRHHNITMNNFKERVKVNAKLRKHILQNKDDNEVQKIMNSDSFALSGGIIRLSHILLFTIDPITKKEKPAEEQNKIYQRLIKLKSKITNAKRFKTAAEKYSDDETTKYNGGDLGYVPRWGLFAKELIEEGYRSKKGDIKGPIKTEFGYHLLTITDVKKGKNLATADLKQKAIDRYIAMKKETILKKWYNDAQIKRHFR